MSTRFELVPDVFRERVQEIIKNDFEHLANARILLLFDLKKRSKTHAITLGWVRLSSEFERFIFSNLRASKFDYVMGFDKRVFLRLDKIDQLDLIRHELKHCFKIDDKWSLLPHDFEIFASEMDAENKWLEQRLRWAEMANRCWEDSSPLPPDNQIELFGNNE